MHDQLTFSPDEAKQALARAEALDRACKDAARRATLRIERLIVARLAALEAASPLASEGMARMLELTNLLAAIRRGEAAP